MANIFLGNEFQSPAKAGNAVNDGGKVFFYERGTSTKKNTYTDNTLATANSNPLTLNSLGRGVAFLQGVYKVRIEDSAGNLIKELDEVNDINTLTDSDRFNKVVNGDFELATISSTLPDKWTITLYTDGTAAIDATDRHSGVNSLKFTSVGTGGGYGVTDGYVSVAPGEQVNVFFSIKSSVVDVRNVVEVLWYTAAKVLDSTTTVYDDSTTNPTVWTYKNVTANAPATAYFAKLRITGCHSSDATPGSTWFDTVSLQNDFILDRPNTFTNTQTMSGAQHRLAMGADIASAATVDLSAATGNSGTITGTTGITAFTLASGTIFVGTFAASLTITHNTTSLICPNNQNIVTQAGDRIVLQGISGGVRVLIHNPQLVSAFSAYQSTLQSIAATTFTRALFQTEEFDNLGEYDAATSRFTAKQAGLYAFAAHVYWAAGVDGERHILSYYKNGAELRRVYDAANGAAVSDLSNGSIILRLAVGDIIDVFIYTSAARDTVVGAALTYFSGMRIA